MNTGSLAQSPLLNHHATCTSLAYNQVGIIRQLREDESLPNEWIRFIRKISQKADLNKAEKWTECDLVKRVMKGLPGKGSYLETSSTETRN